MSMTLTIYSNFSKRRNSTKQPTGGTDTSVNIKDGCSVENPVFLIDGINLNANYCKWDGNYYFIEDIILSNANIYELRCSMDVLATFKTQIGSSTQFVERAASSYDPMVCDNLLSSTQEIVGLYSVQTTLSNMDTTGSYLLNTISKEGINVYAFQTMREINGILSNTSYDGIDDNNQSTLKALVQTVGLNILDASAYVSNVMWVPFAYNSLLGTSEEVGVGFWSLHGFTGKRLTNFGYNGSGSVSMPSNVYASTDFRHNHPEYSRYTIYLPGVGTVALPSICASASITYSYSMDYLTGAITWLIYSEDSGATTIIGQYAGQIGISIPWSTIRVDAISLMESVLAPSINMNGGYSSMAQSAAHAGFQAARNTLETQTSIHGGSGNHMMLALRPNIRVNCTNYGCKEFPLAEAGRPLYEHKQINTLSGYVQCAGASLDIPGMGNEKEKVNSYLNNGFYYE